MSSENDRCFQCQEIGHMACYCPHIWCYDCDNYGHVAMDCLDKILPSSTLACQRTDTNDRCERSPLDIIAIPDVHTMITRIDPDSIVPDLALVTTDIGVVAARTPVEVMPGHSTDLPAIVSHVTGAPVPTATATTHCTADLHLIGILPEMTADLATNPESNTTDWPTDPCPLHKHHLGNIRIRATSKLPSMTYRQSTTVQMIITVTQRMI